jgi:hypothetical protein
MTTRKKIREQVQLLYSQFVDKNGFNDEIDVRLIDILIEQSINRFLKVQVVSNIKAGNIEIPTCNIIEYTLTPTSNTVTLPVFPMTLPLDMGVWKVSLVSNGLAMIPINATMSNVYGPTNASFLENQTGYTVKGNKIKFTTTVTDPVVVELLVSDFGTTGENDPLPVSPDVEADVVTDVLDRISQGRISQPELNVKQNAN